MSNYSHFFSELDQEPNFHLVRIRFGTLKFLKITEGVKANWIVKVSHFGGTAGLFNGFAIIVVFEFLHFGIALIIELFERLKKKGNQSNVVKVRECQGNENNKANCDIKKKLDAMILNFETVKKEMDASKRDIKKLVDINVLEDIINKKIYKR